MAGKHLRVTAWLCPSKVAAPIARTKLLVTTHTLALEQSGGDRAGHRAEATPAMLPQREGEMTLTSTSGCPTWSGTRSRSTTLGWPRRRQRPARPRPQRNPGRLGRRPPANDAKACSSLTPGAAPGRCGPLPDGPTSRGAASRTGKSGRRNGPARLQKRDSERLERSRSLEELEADGTSGRPRAGFVLTTSSGEFGAVARRRGRPPAGRR